MKRVLAVDFGEKRVGMALTDTMQISINPLPAIETNKFDQQIRKYLDLPEVTDVVFGLPFHADGSVTPVGKKVLSIINRFRKNFLNTKFHTIDESFTSKDAVQLMIKLGVKKKDRRNKKKVDSMSAVLILKRFLQEI